MKTFITCILQERRGEFRPPCFLHLCVCLSLSFLFLFLFLCLSLYLSLSHTHSLPLNHHAVVDALITHYSTTPVSKQSATPMLRKPVSLTHPPTASTHAPPGDGIQYAELDMVKKSSSSHGPPPSTAGEPHKTDYAEIVQAPRQVTLRGDAPSSGAAPDGYVIQSIKSDASAPSAVATPTRSSGAYVIQSLATPADSTPFSTPQSTPSAVSHQQCTLKDSSGEGVSGKCPTCAKPFLENDKFCAECGTRKERERKGEGGGGG